MSRIEADTGARVYKRLLGYAKPYWRGFALAVLGLVLAAVTQPLFAALMKPLLDEAIVARNPDSFVRIPLYVLGIFIIRGIAEYFSTYHMSWVGRSVIKTLRREVFDRYLQLPVRYFDQSSSGMLLSKITYNIEQVAESTTNVLTTVVRDSLAILGLLIWMFWLNPWLSLFIFALVPVLVLLVRLASRYFRRYSGRIQDSMGDVTQVADEVIQGQRVVKIFDGEAYEREHFESVNEHNRKLNVKLARVRAASTPVMQMIAALGISSVIYYATSQSSMSPGSFVSFLSALMLITAPLKHLTNINAPLMKGIAAGESIFELIDTPVESREGRPLTQRVNGDIRFDHVTFRYAEDKEPVLCDVSLHVPAGTTTAFVGRSGSGKSTLVNLLPRFYENWQGRILVDGEDTRDLKLADLRRQIALVSQDIVLFNDSIARNIAYGGLKDASRAQIEAAAEAAHAMQFIREMPEGLDTLVGDRGVLLSGGQRQRIAIARALLKDAPILILDEATSALDSESERHIQAALEELMRGRTTLVIAHRLSTIEKADQIAVLREGRIAELGTHSQLLEQGGLYAGLHRMQFRDGQA